MYKDWYKICKSKFIDISINKKYILFTMSSPYLNTPFRQNDFHPSFSLGKCKLFCASIEIEVMDIGSIYNQTVSQVFLFVVDNPTFLEHRGFRTTGEFLLDIHVLVLMIRQQEIMQYCNQYQKLNNLNCWDSLF